MVGRIRTERKVPGIKRRDPHPEARYPSQFVGDRVGEWRRVKNISQEEVAERMQTLGHTSWYRQTVAQVESAARNLTVDELVSLAIALECTVADLFSTATLGDRWLDEDEQVVDLGLSEPMPRPALAAVLGFSHSFGPEVSTPSYTWSDPFEPPRLLYGIRRWGGYAHPETGEPITEEEAIKLANERGGQ